jgi:hypothetical protein
MTNFTPAFASNGLVYTGHQVGPFWSGWIVPLGTANANANASNCSTVSYQLDVVDYTDPKGPVTRDPISIPGRLLGISSTGSVLYTMGSLSASSSGTGDSSSPALQASVYDGVSAHLLDSIFLPGGDGAVTVAGVTVFLATQGKASGAGLLQSWTLNQSGNFTRLGHVGTNLEGTSLKAFGGNLLTAEECDGSFEVFDVSDPTVMTRVGEQAPLGFTSPDLSNADGELGAGVWLPLGAFGVEEIPLLSGTEKGRGDR